MAPFLELVIPHLFFSFFCDIVVDLVLYIIVSWSMEPHVLYIVYLSQWGSITIVTLTIYQLNYVHYTGEILSQSVMLHQSVMSPQHLAYIIVRVDATCSIIIQPLLLAPQLTHL